jgi:hypothetical protein
MTDRIIFYGLGIGSSQIFVKRFILLYSVARIPIILHSRGRRRAESGDRRIATGGKIAVLIEVSIPSKSRGRHETNTQNQY